MTNDKQMTRAELEALVPVLEHVSGPEPGRGFWYVRLADIPEPYRQQFDRSLIGCTIPCVPGEPAQGCVFAHDWRAWLGGFDPGMTEWGRRRPPMR
jgi:hypothetical protein